MVETTNILHQVFKKSSLEEVSIGDLQHLVQKYPYFGAGHFLLAKKLKQAGKSDPQINKTYLYFHNVLWGHYMLNKTETDNSSSQPTSFLKSFILEENIPVVEDDYSEYDRDEEPDNTEAPMTFQIPIPADLNLDKSAPPPSDSEEITFDPYHTIDYFASLGIRLNQDPKPDDKLGIQLRSFTAWLKTMRRLPENESEIVEVNQSDLNAHIEKIAANSLVDREVVTQAMAEVLVLQGNKDKAAAIYHKLSLINPDKSAYFAAKIEELKQS